MSAKEINGSIPARFRLGVDVGGTFTDLLLIDEATGATRRAKTLSTFPDPAVGVLSGVSKIVAEAGIEITQIQHLMHGTTAATNAVLEGKGARVALVVTEGYRQLLHLGRGHIPGGLGAWVGWRQPPPLASIEDTIEVAGRMDASGRVVSDIDSARLSVDLRRLLDLAAIDTFAVALLNAHVDDRHEQAVAQLLRDLGWDGSISLSSAIIPEEGEYERALTTVMNAFVSPAVSDYCETLDRDLRRIGSEARLHVLRSDGGLMSVTAAVAQPVNMLLSGPAGGVAGAVTLARRAGYSNILTLDMGGTSTDVSLVEDGRPGMSRETTVGDFTVRSAAIAVHTVGAGGGSIAHVPEITRALRVGPESAGSEPGPAAYGRGGTRPTVTDANVVLGFLPETKLAGEVAMDIEAAGAAVDAVAMSLDLGRLEAAAGIYDLVNENMLGALRVVSIQSGRDPRNFALVAFGGAGPLHANALARLLGSWPVIIPPAPGVLCAFGDATTRIRNEASKAVVRSLDTMGPPELRDLLADLTSRAAAALHQDDTASMLTVRYEADLRYQGQSEPLTVALAEALVNSDDVIAQMSKILDAEHDRLYTFTLDSPIELVSLRSIVELGLDAPDPPRLERGDGSSERARIGQGRAWMDGREVEVVILDRARLLAGDRVDGPAIVTEMDSTTLVLPGHFGEVDGFANLIIRPDGSEVPDKPQERA